MEKITMLIALLPFLALAQTQDKCIPYCAPGDIPPARGGPPCLCSYQTTLPGCVVSPCKPGDDTNTYTCQCTPSNHPNQCTSLRCTNGTEAHSSVVTATSNSNDQAIASSCNNLCNCDVQPPDCTKYSGSPYDGAPACSCTTYNWPAGCTLKPCKTNDTGDNYYNCECTDKYAPDFCVNSQCKHNLI